MIAFGGLSWALDGAAAPVAAVLRLEGAMDAAGALLGQPRGGRHAGAGDLFSQCEFRLSARLASRCWKGSI